MILLFSCDLNNTSNITYEKIKPRYAFLCCRFALHGNQNLIEKLWRVPFPHLSAPPYCSTKNALCHEWLLDCFLVFPYSLSPIVVLYCGGVGRCVRDILTCVVYVDHDLSPFQFFHAYMQTFVRSVIHIFCWQRYASFALRKIWSYGLNLTRSVLKDFKDFKRYQVYLFFMDQRPQRFYLHLFVFSFFSFFGWKSPPFLLYPPTHVSTHNNTHVSRNTHTWTHTWAHT